MNMLHVTLTGEPEKEIKTEKLFRYWSKIFSSSSMPLICSLKKKRIQSISLSGYKALSLDLIAIQVKNTEILCGRG